ncbi:MAG: Rrf2 family transcriptional regulator [Clostridia bacterium]|nr:Rrf2 family transcriptional regulator [Clostridia bacterium]
MHITLESDYAIRIVDYLSHQTEKKSAAQIAEDSSVPQRFALKILSKLASCDIVKSFKGTKGGYILAKEPGEITLRLVIEAVEGPYVLSRCLYSGHECSRGDGPCCCRFQSVFDEISADVRKKLDTVTFADD